VTRTAGWGNKTCSRDCGIVLSHEAAKKPASVGVCEVCEEEFTYHRPGTKPRKLCDADECRSEHSRRTASARKRNEKGTLA
jgi:hypothetical protein